MVIAYACVLMAALLPYLFTVLAKASKTFDNRAPREYLASLEGWRKRANWVQMNGFEAFPPFAAAVIIAEQLQHASQNHINILAVTFVVARILYGFFYLLDKPILRTLTWFLGFASVITLFIVSLQ